VALDLVDRRLAEAPGDLEARGWRARLLAWTGRWTEAEAEYRRVLEAAPHDVDILLGLADVLRWQGRRDEALGYLDRAAALAPQQAEVHTRRARVLQELGRSEEARGAYGEALRLAPDNAEARAGLDALEPAPRHELRIETDFDHYPFTEDAQSVITRLRSQIGSRWTTDVAGNFQHRFGEQVGAFLGSLAYRLGHQNTLTVGGAAGHDAGVIPRGEAFFEYDRGFQFDRGSGVQGLELGYRQRWVWFRDAQARVLTPYAVVYFPKDWYVYVAISAARTRISGGSAEWQPSGLMRLTFPLHRRLAGNVFFGVGTENFAQVDQVGRFSARTYGGGLRWHMARHQELAGYVFYQDRSQGRTEIGFGFSYGIRF
jgi:YaiO family outer membrane protein